MSRRTKEEQETKNIKLKKDRRGRDRWELRKQWPDGDILRRWMPHENAVSLLKRIEAAIDYGMDGEKGWKALKKELGRDLNSGSSSEFNKGMTIAELCDLHYEKYVVPHNKKSLDYKLQHLTKIKDLAGKKLVVEFTMKDAEDVKLARLEEGGVSNDTINKTLSTMCRMFNWAVHTKKFLAANPMAKWKRLKVVRQTRPRLTPLEYRKIVMEACRIDVLRGVFIGVCCETAVRPWAEGAHLKRTLVELNGPGDNWITIEPSKHDNEPKRIPLSSFAVELIQKLPVYFDTDYLFYRYGDKRGEFMTRDYVHSVWVEACKAAGCAWATEYDLRRYRATTWAAGSPLPNVQEWLRHEDIRTTMIYVQAVDHQRHMREAEEKEYKRFIDAARKEDGNGDIPASA